jgi:hypothetical protein
MHKLRVFIHTHLYKNVFPIFFKKKKKIKPLHVQTIFFLLCHARSSFSFFNWDKKMKKDQFILFSSNADLVQHFKLWKIVYCNLKMNFIRKIHGKFFCLLAFVDKYRNSKLLDCWYILLNYDNFFINIRKKCAKNCYIILFCLESTSTMWKFFLSIDNKASNILHGQLHL